MRKFLALFAITGLLTFGMSNLSYAEEGETTTEQVEENGTANGSAEDPGAEEDKGTVAGLKQRFLEGGPFFMSIVLACLIIGLALSIERIIYLNMATISKKKFIEEIDELVSTQGIEAAKEHAKNTRGPIASIFYQGLDRSDEGIDMVEKSVISYGGVQMGLLEKGLSWISLFIALAPMLGFMGTVIGMIDAFDAIIKEGNISPTVVAGGIKVALLTTVFGLIVAIILQLCYNYVVSKVDSIVNDMEDASISLVDILLKNKKAN